MTKAGSLVLTPSVVSASLVPIQSVSLRRKQLAIQRVGSLAIDADGNPSPFASPLAYRARAVRDPRGVLADFGLTLPESVDICVWDASAETRFLVLPRRPAGTEGWSEEQLAGLVTRAGMIGTAAV